MNINAQQVILNDTWQQLKFILNFISNVSIVATSEHHQSYGDINLIQT